MTSFDIDKLIAEAGLPPEVVADILREAEADYPDRGALYELRVVRGIHSEMEQRMGTEAWIAYMDEAVQKMLDEHGYEFVSEPVPTQERLRRKRAKAS